MTHRSTFFNSDEHLGRRILPNETFDALGNYRAPRVLKSPISSLPARSSSGKLTVEHPTETIGFLANRPTRVEHVSGIIDPHIIVRRVSIGEECVLDMPVALRFFQHAPFAMRTLNAGEKLQIDLELLGRYPACWELVLETSEAL